jgi:hypothetical protein
VQGSGQRQKGWDSNDLNSRESAEKADCESSSRRHGSGSLEAAALEASIFNM